MRSASVILALILFAAPAAAQEVAIADSAARAATESWLALVDSTQYAASWEEAAPVFKQAVTSAQWAQAAAQVRGQLGGLQERTLLSVRATKELPNMPAGDYMLLEYMSRFTQMPRAVETHVLMLGDDAVWRTAGYFVRPAQ